LARFTVDTAVNKNGHSETLVSSHPGNTNAAKAGVYSERILAPRVKDLDDAIASRPVDEVVLEINRRRVAGLSALIEAMDEELGTGGLVGRDGKVRELVKQRLRGDDKLRIALSRLRSLGPSGREHWAGQRRLGL
jgi:hypothetical protein